MKAWLGAAGLALAMALAHLGCAARGWRQDESARIGRVMGSGAEKPDREASSGVPAPHPQAAPARPQASRPQPSPGASTTLSSAKKESEAGRAIDLDRLAAPGRQRARRGR